MYYKKNDVKPYYKGLLNQNVNYDQNKLQLGNKPIILNKMPQNNQKNNDSKSINMVDGMQKLPQSKKVENMIKSIQKSISSKIILIREADSKKIPSLDKSKKKTNSQSKIKSIDNNVQNEIKQANSIKKQPANKLIKSSQKINSNSKSVQKNIAQTISPNLCKKIPSQLPPSNKNIVQRKDFNLASSHKPKNMIVPPLPNKLIIRKLQKIDGKCYLQPNKTQRSANSRQVYNITLIRSRLSIKTSEGQIYRHVNFETVIAFVASQGNGLKVKFEGTEANIYIEPILNDLNLCQKWIYQIKQCIQSSRLNDILQDKINRSFQGGKPVEKDDHLPYLIKKSKQDFFLKEQVCLDQFYHEAKTGDIILFRGDCSWTFQRKFTNSQYDHVGIFYKNIKGRPCLFDILGGDRGTQTFTWKYAIEIHYYSQYSKICWRPLSRELTKEQMEIVENFVIKTQKSQYSLHATKFLRSSSPLKKTEKEQKESTYFCSELIARLYKQLGFLDPNKSSASYFPVHFSQRQKLKIIKPDISLLNQRLIALDW